MDLCSGVTFLSGVKLGKAGLAMAAPQRLFKQTGIAKLLQMVAQAIILPSHRHHKHT